MKMNRPFLLLIVLFVSFHSGFAQTIIQQRTIVAKNQNYFGCNYALLSNGLYYMEGSDTDAFGDKSVVGYGQRDCWTIRMDENLEIQEEFVFGGSGIDVPTNIAEFSNGDLLIAIQSSSDSSGIGTIKTRRLPDENSYDDIIFRVNQQGEVQWERRIGGIYSDRIYSVKIYNDTVYMAGSAFSDISPNKQCSTYGDSDFWFVSLSPNGEVLVDKNYGGTEEDRAFDIWVNESNVFLIGITRSQISGNKTSNTYNSSVDNWLIKLNKQGEIISQKNINGDQSDGQAFLVSTNDNQLIACIGSNSTVSGDKSVANKGGYDVWLIKFDLDLNILSQATIGSQGDDGLFSINPSHGQLFLSMTSNSGVNGDKTSTPKGGYDYWMVVISEDFVIQSQLGYGGSGDDRLYNTFITKPGELILAGVSDSPISGDKTVANNLNYNNAWVMKVSAPLGLEKEKRYSKTAVYPIPAIHMIKVELNFLESGKGYTILDNNGKIVDSGILNSNPIQEINLSKLERGIYFLQIENQLTKIIKE